MITKKDIRPIPKYILKKIQQIDEKRYPTSCGCRRFYSYLTKWQNELVKVTVAVRHHKKQWYCKQVTIHGLHTSVSYVKDLIYYRAYGYFVGWHDLGLYTEPRHYEDGNWYENQYPTLFSFQSPIINLDFLKRFPEYKYCPCDIYYGDNIFYFLRLYEEYPQIEYLIKNGFKYLALSKQILAQVEKDKAFRRWLIENKNELTKYYYTVPTILHAYKWKWSLTETHIFETRKKEMIQQTSKPLTTFFKGKSLTKLFQYIDEQQITYNSYRDYLNACLKLELDMTQKKNLFPHDFNTWHDIRINEYTSKKVQIDKKEYQRFVEKFAKISYKYLPLQSYSNNDYVVFIAQSPKELVAEGKKLHHCVGKMGYDQKFVKQESLIFFVRNIKKPKQPFYTVEYSLKRKSILQCQGLDHCSPNESVRDFVYNQWLPHANNELSLIRKEKLAA